MKKFIIHLGLLFLLTIIPTEFVISQYWQKIINIPQPYTNNYWLDVYFHPANPNYGWICGFNGMIIRTTDGGNSWRGSTVNAYHLESVHFPTLQVGYVSGVEGIFKSTDGGATWFDITPPGTRDTTTFWGCYFLNENYGVLVGDGCYGRNQHFWLTTDGGSSWSVFIGTEENSGMTDAMLYPNGLGYASSSGRIWITQDSGKTWQVFSISGTELWQEEITNIGQSFLVPYAGTTCTGGGNDGGMRFTTNNGATWNSFRTGLPMFGTFLIDSQKGWACGYSREVYYTSNGGINWQRRNCGIESGNLDDLWFIDENNGWVVGEGVYKLSNPKGVASKNSINFGEFCVGLKKYDTVWVRNYNFNDVAISLSLSSPSNEFEIVSPGSSGYIQSCDSLRIVVAFVPKTAGNKNGTLTIQYPFQAPINISLTGSAINSSARLLDTLIILNNAKCGFTYPITAKISVQDIGEFVSEVVPIKGDNIFKFLTTLPLQLNPSRENTLNFEVSPNDSGWKEITYRVRFSPCDTFQYLKIRVYAVSPIINLDSAIEMDFQCATSPIKIPIFNSGNDTLFFRKFSFSPQTNKLIITGWASGNSLIDNFILPKQSDTLILFIDTAFVGTISTNLIIENNDFRTIRGPRNIVQVRINIQIFLPKIALSKKFLDFGKICVGDTSTNFFTFSNKGNLEELFLNVKQKFPKIFIVKNPFPLNVKSFDSLIVRVDFVSNQIGKFIDTLLFISFNCKDTFQVICFGEAVKTNVNYFPKQINLRIQKGQTKVQLVDFFTSSLDSFKLINFDVSGEIKDFLTKVTFITDTIFSQNDTLSIEFAFVGKEKGRYFGTIYFVFDGICDTVVAIPVVLEIFDKNLVIEPSFIDFGEILCNPTVKTESIFVKNLSETPDTVSNIFLEQKFGQFYFAVLPNLPLVLKPYDSVEIKVSFEPKIKGFDTANVIFEFQDSTRNITTTVVAFYGFSEIAITPQKVDFGSLEFCELPLTKIVSVKNSGNITDTLFLVKEFSNDVFEFQVSNWILSGSVNDSAIINISFLDREKTGDFVDTLILGFKNCPSYDTVIVSGSVIVPNISISPQILDFGEVWMGMSKTDGFIISNLFDKSVIVSIDSCEISENIKIDTNFSHSVEPSGQVKFNVELFANKEGEYWDTICFKLYSKCEYRYCVLVHYIIPKERYELTFKIGKYLVKPDEIVDVKIENLTPNNLLKLENLLLTVSYDNFLFYPLQITIDNQNINFKSEFGELELLISERPLEHFLNFGKPIVITGRALYSSPDSTILDLKVARFSPGKEISFNLIDGWLKVYPVCEPIGATRLELIPVFEILGLSFDENGSFIILHSSDQQRINLYCFDVLGNNLGNFELDLETGVNRINLNKFISENSPKSNLFIVFSNGHYRKVVFVPIVH